MIKRKYVLICFLFVFITDSESADKDKWIPFIGTWEYRQKNSGNKSGYDDEGERIIIKKKESAVVGIYFGLEREGEHGLYYSVVEVIELILNDSGQISFTVPGRDFFNKRPKSIEEAKQMREEFGGGGTKDHLKYKGNISNGMLILYCSTLYGNCPDKKLIFYRGKWK